MTAVTAASSMEGKGRLKERLSAVAGFVTDGLRLCDVGCDHAYLSIALVQSGRIPSAVALDVKEGPLERARVNVEEAGLSGVIDLRLSDGLCGVRRGECDCIVLSGMGGQLIMDILDRQREVSDAAREWILSPQSEWEEIRRWIRGRGRSIVDEEMVRERGKLYLVLKVEGPRDEQEREALPLEWEDAFGPALLRKCHPLLKEYLILEEQRLSGILEKLAGRGDDNSLRLASMHRRTQDALVWLGETG